MRVRPSFEISSPQELQRALDAWTLLAQAELVRARRAGHPLPPVLRSGVRYRREQPGREQWQTPVQTLQKQHGDCEDLATWRAAELRLAGVNSARVRVKRGGNRLWHIYVTYERNGQRVVEDPSKALGMKGDA